MEQFTYSGLDGTKRAESLAAIVLGLRSMMFQEWLGYLLLNRNKMGPGGPNEKSKVNEKTG